MYVNKENRVHSLRETSRREMSFLVPLDMSGNALLRVLDTLADSRKITRKSLSREKGETP